MNKQKNGIGWTKVYGRPGYTWNPTGGCFHNCTWRIPDGSISECYAKTTAERLKSDKFFPEGFRHHYFYPDRLAEPARVKQPSGIFVGSMADLFGGWVPGNQISQILAVMGACHWHKFLILTKNPKRLAEFNPYPDNVWVGCSIPAGNITLEKAHQTLWKFAGYMKDVMAPVKFLSAEPLWFDIEPVLKHDPDIFNWVIVGAASNGAKKYQPDTGHVRYLRDYCDYYGIPMYFKSNMIWSEMRKEFPKEKNND